MRSDRASTPIDQTSLKVNLWGDRVMEALWLIIVILIPVAFINPDRFLSEAVIANFEVPKIAALRVLVGLMTIVWLLQWAFNGRLVPNSNLTAWSSGFTPGRWLSTSYDWYQNNPNWWSRFLSDKTVEWFKSKDNWWAQISENAKNNENL